jgi:enterochelin esterase family protein
VSDRIVNPRLAILADSAPDGSPDADAVDAFIADNEFPLADPDGVTFVYRGEADEVMLQHWVFGLPSSQPLHRLGESDLWHLFVELPPRSRIEYKLDVIRDGVGGWITDPLNPLTAADPFGRNSVCRAFGYRRPDWTMPDPTVRSGHLDGIEIASRVLKERRHVPVYLPARFRRSRRYPLLVVHDGMDFVQFADFKAVLDNLIERLEIPPLVAVLTQATDRLREYAGDPRHADFVVKELLPALQSRYPLYDDPGHRALMGASFGAVASLATAWRHPGVFDKLLLLSGSFAFSDIGGHSRGPVFDPVVAFMNRFRRSPGRPARDLYVACGIYESLIYENRSLVPLLQQHGMRVRYREVHDGHNWENWRDRQQDALSWLLPGPLWMIYE